MNAIALTLDEQVQLEAYEVVIANGLQTFYEVGTALAEIRDNRLYRAEFKTFEDYCDQRWGIGRNYANKVIAASKVVKNLGTNVPTLPVSESQTRPLTSLPPHEQQRAWQEAVDTAPNGKPTAAHVQRIVNTQRAHVGSYDPDEEYSERDEWASRPIDKATGEYLDTPAAKPHVAHNSGQNEWYTPPDIIEAARRVMGEITLDPASSAIANRIVGATYFYTCDDDGLSQDWTGCVWLNPPYSQPEIGQFSDKVHQEIHRIEQLSVLVNNATETVWFQKLLEIADAVCFLKSRVKFLDINLKPNGAPLQGQAILYVGPNTDAFCTEFSSLGAILEPR